MKTIKEIEEIRKVKKEELDLRENEKCQYYWKTYILVCGGTGCTSSKSIEIIEKLEEVIKSENIENVKVIKNRLFWVMCQRTNCNYKTRKHFLCISYYKRCRRYNKFTYKKKENCRKTFSKKI